MNFHIAHLCLCQSKQRDTESMDNFLFLARCRLQVKKCKFQDDIDTEIQLLEQAIFGTKHTELQKQLLAKSENMTLEEAQNIGRAYKTSIGHRLIQLCDTCLEHQKM